MKKYTISIILIFTFLAANIGYAQNYKKLAQAGFDFLSMSNDARASSLGEAVTSVEGTSSSMFYNPASMARLGGFSDVSLGRTNWIADINYLHGSVAINPFDGQFGVFGISAVYVDYGDFQRTIRSSSASAGYLDMGTYKPYALAVGLGYAKALSDKFSLGANIRYAKQSLGADQIYTVATDGSYGKKDYSANTLVYDFGVLYKTGFKSLNLGMDIKNFSQDVKYEKETFSLPMTLNIGISMNVFELLPNINQDVHSLLITANASHPRDYQEQIGIGGEYWFMKTVALRLGYVFPTDESGISAGLGLKQNISGYDLGFDYSYTSFGVFSDVHRFTLHFAL
jgi:hypothetical protein